MINRPSEIYGAGKVVSFRDRGHLRGLMDKTYDEPPAESGSDSDWEEWADEDDTLEVDAPVAGAIGPQPRVLSEVEVVDTVIPFWERERSLKKIVIIYHTIFGHLTTLAEQILEGVLSVDGCEAFIYQVEEIYPQKFLDRLGAAPKTEQYPTLSRSVIKRLAQADGIVIGASSRFGAIPAPVKNFFDATGSLWLHGALIGKPATIFTSTPTQNGGQDVLAMSIITQLAHHGMPFVACGYPTKRRAQAQSAAQGNDVEAQSVFGATTYTGIDGIRSPSAAERAAARHQGAHFAGVIKRMRTPRQPA